MEKQELRQLLETTVNFIKRDIKIRYANSILGSLWIVLYPLSLTFTSTIIFSFIFKDKVGDVPYFLFAMLGFINWVFFIQSIGQATRSLVWNRSLVCNTKTPRESIVISAVLSRFLDYFISLLVFLVLFFIVQRIFFIKEVFMLLGITFLQIIFQLGLSLITAGLNVYYRDVQNIVDIGLRLLFYITPVIYPLGIVPKKFRGIIKFNPLSLIMNLSRDLMFKQKVDLLSLVIVVTVSLFTFLSGIILFRKMEDKFAEAI